MPQPIGTLSEYPATPLPSAYDFSQIDPARPPTSHLVDASTLTQPDHSVSQQWLSGLKAPDSHQFLHIPTPLFVVPTGSYLLRHSPDKATTSTRLSREHSLENRADTHESFGYSAPLSYRITGTNTSFAIPTIVYPTTVPPSLFTRSCHCSHIQPNDFISQRSRQDIDSQASTHTGDLGSHNTLQTHLCPGPFTAFSDYASCFPCSSLYPVDDSLAASGLYANHSAPTFPMDHANNIGLNVPQNELCVTCSESYFPMLSHPSGEQSMLGQSGDRIPNENSSAHCAASKSVEAEQQSAFLNSSCSDIPLSNLEELLARSSIDDVYVGPVKGPDGKLLPLDPSVRTVNECLSLPYSSSSLAFSPPGIIMVAEVWSMFVNDRLSACNHRIHGMNLETLRNCLYEHGLNQLGSVSILRRRLQEFVRRLRNALSSNNNKSAGLGLPDKPQESDESIPAPPLPFDRPVKLPKPVILAPDTFYSYLLIIDLEATCDFQERKQQTPEYPHEIIEFPVLLYNTRTRRCVGVFHSYCKPKLNPDLTSFCTNLTQISQTQVDNAHPFSHVLAQIEKWLFEKHGLSDARCAIVCDCSADMSKFMRIQCRLDKIPLPSWATVWINLSKAFRIFYKLSDRNRVTLNTMLQDLNLSFIGQQHRGLDDAINILRVVRTLLADGCLLRVNERVDFGRPPNYVTPVPRLVAENTSGLMGSRLILLTRKSKSSTQHEKEHPNSLLPLDLPEDHRQSLLWLASVQRSRVPRDQ